MYATVILSRLFIDEDIGVVHGSMSRNCSLRLVSKQVTVITASNKLFVCVDELTTLS